MNLDQLIGRSVRFRHELARARQDHPSQNRLIDRLSHDLAATEQEIAQLMTGLGSAASMEAEEVLNS